MSINDSHFAGMTTVITGNRVRKSMSKREQKTGSDGADVICCGRLFQIHAAATGKAWSP